MSNEIVWNRALRDIANSRFEKAWDSSPKEKMQNIEGEEKEKMTRINKEQQRYLEESIFKKHQNEEVLAKQILSENNELQVETNLVVPKTEEGKKSRSSLRAYTNMKTLIFDRKNKQNPKPRRDSVNECKF